MKKIVFSLMTLLALVVMAGSANAQGKFAPIPGGTYHYTLPIVIANQSDAVLTATGLTNGTSVITNITPSLTDIATTVTEISFDVTYSNSATGTCKIEFTITDELSGCANYIYLDVPMNPVPTYTLNIVASITETCQTRAGAGDNTPDALGDGSEANSFTFTVTPVVTGVTGNFTYSYTIDLPTNAVLLSFNNGAGGVSNYSGGVVTYTGVGSVATDIFTVAFNTTTGVDTQTLTATLTDGASSTLVPVDGGGTYEATMASGGNLTQSVAVKAVPKIGSFN
jgi:hypothetical protein